MDITTLDLSLLNLVSEKLSSPVMDKIMIFITQTGNAGIIWILLIVLCLIFRKTRKAGVAMAVSLAVGMLFGGVFLKLLINRTRPFILMDISILIPPPLGTSFPSGHAMSGFLTAFALFLHHKAFGAFALLYAGLISFSRLYLYVHFPSDAIGGAILGIIVAAALTPLSHILYDKLTAFIERKRKHG